MTVTPNRFPVDEPLTTLERWRYRAACAYVTSWQYRDFAKDDRTFLEVLMANGVEIATVFDVGASNGAWGLMVPHFIPGIRSFMFEPLVGHSEGYSRFMRGLLSSHPDWTLFTCALSDKEGETTIYMDKNVYGSTLIPGPYAEANWQKIDVEVRTIDGLVASGDATQPDVIKIDTQGSELAILKGGERVLAGTKALLLETWLTRGYGPRTPLLTELVPWLAERNFVPVEFADGYRSPDGLMRSVDAFFLRRDIAEKVKYAL